MTEQLNLPTSLQPGQELDTLVAKAMGWKLINPETTAHKSGYRWLKPDGHKVGSIWFSATIELAWIAWEWLEQNQPWGAVALSRGALDQDYYAEQYGFRARLFEKLEGSYPRVKVLQTKKGKLLATFDIPGESYAHAICLAVVLVDLVSIEPGRPLESIDFVKNLVRF